MPFERTVNLSDPQVAAMVCDAIRSEKGERVVIVKELTRTIAQNRLYWVSVCEPLAQWLTATEGVQWTKDDVHYDLRKCFLPLTEHISPISGKLIYVPKSTTKLTKSDFSLLCEKGWLVLDKLRGEAKGNRRAG